jgi:quercetin dioxygenase-like cupin family protein
MSDVRAYCLLDVLAIVQVSGDETEGRFSLVEMLMPPGDMTPLHVHLRDSQTVYVLEGEVTFYLPNSVQVCGRGEFIHQPAGVAQTERVTSTQPARILGLNSPSGFDRFVASAGRPARSLVLPPPPEHPPDMERLVEIAAEHDIEILGPPGELP